MKHFLLSRFSPLFFFVFLSASVYAQALPEIKSYDGVADRTITIEDMDKLEIRVGEVVDVYCDNYSITSYFWESNMSSCWVDHAWVFHSDGTANKHPNSRYVAISHLDPSIGLSRLYGLEPTNGFIMMEMYYSLSWRYPGSRVYVLQDDYPFQLKVYAVKPKSVSVQEEISLRVGNTAVLEPSLTPSDAYSKYTWTSSDDEIATVNEEGKVTAVSEGKAVIKVTTDNGLSASCKVSVVPAPDEIVLPSEVNIYVGYGYRLNPQLLPDGTDATFSWSSSDKSVAKVDSRGYVSAVAAGEATITVKTDNNLKASVNVTVDKAPDGLSSKDSNARISVIKKLVNRTL